MEVTAKIRARASHFSQSVRRDIKRKMKCIVVLILKVNFQFKSLQFFIIK